MNLEICIPEVYSTLLMIIFTVVIISVLENYCIEMDFGVGIYYYINILLKHF